MAKKNRPYEAAGVTMLVIDDDAPLAPVSGSIVAPTKTLVDIGRSAMSHLAKAEANVFGVRENLFGLGAAPEEKESCMSLREILDNLAHRAVKLEIIFTGRLREDISGSR